MSDQYERYCEFIKHLPVDAKDKSLIALKGHLLLETALREYVYRRVKHPERLRKKQIGFSTLIDFASSLEDCNKIQWVWKALRQANEIRNQIAHQLEPAKLAKLESEFVSYVESNDGVFSVAMERELGYEKLALVFFQMFDVLVNFVEVRDPSIKFPEAKRHVSKEGSFDSILGYKLLIPEVPHNAKSLSRYEPPVPSQNIKKKY